jgi:hypothetical protein
MNKPGPAATARLTKPGNVKKGKKRKKNVLDWQKI